MTLNYKILGQYSLTANDFNTTDILYLADNNRGAYVSTDGFNWQNYTVNSTWGQSAMAAQDSNIGTIVAASFGSANSNKLSYSFDGINWNQYLKNISGQDVDTPVANPFIYYAKDRFFLSSGYNNGAYTIYPTDMLQSFDGINWFKNGPDLPTNPHDFIYFNNKYIAWYGQYLFKSTDATNWLEDPNFNFYPYTFDDTARFIIINNNIYVFDNAGNYFKSADGDIWTLGVIDSDLSSSVRFGKASIANGTIFVHFWMDFSNGYQQENRLYYSTDGINWSYTTSLPYPSYFYQEYTVYYLNNTYFAYLTDYSGTFATSTDGISWSQQGSNSPLYFGQSYIQQFKNYVNPLQDSLIYTVPNNKSTVVTSITVANDKGFNVGYNLAVVPQGEQLSNKHYLKYNTQLLGPAVDSLGTKLTLSSGDKIYFSSLKPGTNHITITGVER